MKVKIYPPIGFSELGGRSNNEDALYPPVETVTASNTLFLVCDGVGGHSKGEVASSLACEDIPQYFKQNPVLVADQTYVEQAIRHARYGLQKELSLAGANTQDASNMATTVTLLQLNEAGVTMAHLGDSRIYQLRNGQIIRRTEDHSFVNQLVKAGMITPEEAATHPRRNQITRSLNCDEDDSNDIPDVRIINDVLPGDYFFMCTDGVLEQLYDELLTYYLFAPNLQENADKMEAIRKACYGNTRDNFTAYLIQIASVDGEVPARYSTSDTILAATNTPVAVPVVAESAPTYIQPIRAEENYPLPAHSYEGHNSYVQPTYDTHQPKHVATSQKSRSLLVPAILLSTFIALAGVGYWVFGRAQEPDAAASLPTAATNTPVPISTAVHPTKPKPSKLATALDELKDHAEETHSSPKEASNPKEIKPAKEVTKATKREFINVGKDVKLEPIGPSQEQGKAFVIQNNKPVGGTADYWKRPTFVWYKFSDKPTGVVYLIKPDRRIEKVTERPRVYNNFLLINKPEGSDKKFDVSTGEEIGVTTGAGTAKKTSVEETPSEKPEPNAELTDDEGPKSEGQPLKQKNTGEGKVQGKSPETKKTTKSN
jgi:protein phosphatase